MNDAVNCVTRHRGRTSTARDATALPIVAVTLAANSRPSAGTAYSWVKVVTSRGCEPGRVDSSGPPGRRVLSAPSPQVTVTRPGDGVWWTVAVAMTESLVTV